MEFLLRIFFGNLLLKQKCIMRYATICLHAYPHEQKSLYLSFPPRPSLPLSLTHSIYLKQINLLLSTDQTRKRKLTCEMNTNIVLSCESSFVLTYIHNVYACTLHSYAHWNFYHVRIFFSLIFHSRQCANNRKKTRGKNQFKM